MELLGEQFIIEEPVKKDDVVIEIVNHIPDIRSTDIDITKINLVRFSQIKEQFPNEPDECIGKREHIHLYKFIR